MRYLFYFILRTMFMARLVTLTFLCLSTAAFAQKTKQAGWQQKTDYTISVTLDDSLNLLNGFETVVYHNNSPDNITEIFFHLWPNAYLNNNTPFAKQQYENGQGDFYFSEYKDRGRMDSLNFKVDGEKIKVEFLEGGFEIAKLILNRPLGSGKKAVITTSFRVKIPKVFSRLGHEDQTYCITQWYPKPAVYDVNGWNPMPYLDQGEFYSEFGRFEVTIRVPENYIVAATGNLQNLDEHLKLMDMSAQPFKKESDCDKSFNPVSAKKYKALTYIQDSIHDFAWFADKRFKVERSKVTLANGHTVTTWLYEICPNKSSIKWVDSAITFYSEKVGYYPYANATVVVTPLKAGGGMEYPTITNVGEAERQVIVHEVGHNWFYGILGTNERLYPWMDESINNYYEARSNYKPRYIHNHQLDLKGLSIDLPNSFNSPFGMLDIQFLYSARKRSDQKATLPSREFTNLNYGTIIYSKASLAFLQLQNYLGDERFDAMMKSYYETWKFKHPLPDDFIGHVKNYTGEELSWFFDGLLNSTENPDMKISSVKKSGDSLVVILKSNPRLITPFYLQTFDISNNLIQEVKVVPSTGKTTLKLGANGVSKIVIDAKQEAIDVFRGNNYARTKGILKTLGLPSVKPILNLENPEKIQVFYSPVLGMNLYNKTMLGVAFYNSLLPRKKTEFLVMPMYAFGTKDLTGYLDVQHRFFTRGAIKEVQVGFEGARFATFGIIPKLFTDTATNVSTEGVVDALKSYEKYAPRVSFLFKNNSPRSKANLKLDIRYILISEQAFTKRMFTNLSDASQFVDINFSATKNHKFAPRKFNANYQIGDVGNSFQKLTLEYSLRIPYEQAKKGLHMRFFFGTFLQKPGSSLEAERVFLRLGDNSGYYDYLYDYAQFGRGNSTSMFNQQMMPRTPGFRGFVLATGATDHSVLTANFTSTVPFKLPIRPYVDIAMVNALFNRTTNAGVQRGYELNLHYVAGVSIWMGEFLQVNFPILADKSIQEGWDATSNYSERINFTLNLNLLNPLKAVREFDLF